MQSFIRRAVVGALILASAGILAAGASAAARHKPLMLPADYQAWSRVARCESGGWQVLGSAYPDSLGITRANYAASGGRALLPGPVSLVDRIAEIRAADRLVARYRVAIPDQRGCAAW
jgi:hypothetical protein